MPRWPSPAELGAQLRHRIPLLGGAAVVVLLAGLVLSTSRDPQPRTLPPPSSTSSTAPAAPTTEPDWSLASLPVIEGGTTTTAPRTDGFVTLRGRVTGPDGPVPGAVVVADRLVDDAVQRFEARAGGDGAYELAGVPGGRYRVRAYLPPTLAMPDAEIFFQRDFETRDLDLRLEAFSGVVVRASVAPRTPVDGRGVNLAVLVAERRVGDDGIAREVPVGGIPVRVTASGWTGVDGGAARTTDGDGIAVFQFRCTGSGSVSATALVGAGSTTATTGGTDPADPSAATTTSTTAALSGTFPLDVPGCSPVPTTTTTTTTSLDDGAGDDSQGSGSTTTTEG